jgi:hypothetical protein
MVSDRLTRAFVYRVIRLNGFLIAFLIVTPG